MDGAVGAVGVGVGMGAVGGVGAVASAGSSGAPDASASSSASSATPSSSVNISENAKMAAAIAEANMSSDGKLNSMSFSDSPDAKSTMDVGFNPRKNSENPNIASAVASYASIAGLM